MQKSGYIAIIGRPNSGKSTLMNSILGTQVSIVTPKAQTTRDQIQGILTESKGQIIFVDTPGIHRAREGGLNEFMVNQAKEALSSPDLIWYLVDPASSLEHETLVIEILKEASKGAPKDTPVFLLLNKWDTLQGEAEREKLARFEKSIQEACIQKGIQIKAVERISAIRRSGLKRLLSSSWLLLPEGAPFYPDADQVSDRPTRFFVAEKIREQLFRWLGDEVPYSCAVEINQFQENSNPVRIEATIYVERESQKGIVIGKGGLKIKEIGQSARKEIERFLGTKIFLGLKVDLVRNWTQNWSKDTQSLSKVGYSS